MTITGRAALAGFAVAVVTALPALAAPGAQLTAKALLASCEAHDTASGNACHFYLAGAVQGLALAAAAANDRHTFCFPGNLPPDGVATLYVSIAGDDIQKYPDDGAKPAIALVASVMVHHYPCPK